MRSAHPEERRHRLDEATQPWQPRTLWQLLDHAADRFGDAPFIVTDNRTYTYADVREWSARLAAGLVNLGVRTGEHVALVMANHPEFVALKFAIARAGAVTVPVNFLLRERELAYVLRQSDAVALITMSSFRDHDYIAIADSIMPGWETDGGGETVPTLRNVVVFGDPPAGRAWCTVADLEDLGVGSAATAMESLEHIDGRSDPGWFSDILYTSGTTGTPKGTLLTHDMVVRTGYAAAYSRALAPGHRVVFALPMYHVFGYIECLLAVMWVGGAVVPRPVFDPVDVLTAVGTHGADEIACVPTMTLALLDAARVGTYDLSTLRIVYSSGTAAPETIHAQIREVLGPDELVAGYGQTETTAAMTSTRPEESDDYLRTTNGRFRPAGAAGDPALGGVLAVYKTVDVVTGEDLPSGTTGHLVVKGPAVTSGYYNKPEETASAFDDNGWFRTGDLGMIDADGCLSLSGRLKETYRCGGEMVMPREIELLLMEHPAVADAHVAGIPDPRMGEVGCAFVVLRSEMATTPTAEALIELCRSQLARFKVPRHVLFVEATQLPRTVTGRVQKFALVEAALATLGASKSAPAQ